MCLWNLHLKVIRRAAIHIDMDFCLKMIHIIKWIFLFLSFATFTAINIHIIITTFNKNLFKGVI
jgi:hypothetical protein